MSAPTTRPSVATAHRTCSFVGTQQGVAGLTPRPFTLEEETGSHNGHGHVHRTRMLICMHNWGSSLHLPPHRRSSIIIISRDAATASHRQRGELRGCCHLRKAGVFADSHPPTGGPRWPRVASAPCSFSCPCCRPCASSPPAHRPRRRRPASAPPRPRRPRRLCRPAPVRPPPPRRRPRRLLFMLFMLFMQLARSTLVDP